MSNIIAPRDNKVVKKEPDEMFPNLWADQDFQIGSLDISGTLQVQDIIVSDTVVANAFIANSDIVVNGFIDASGGISFGDEPLDNYQEVSSGISLTGPATVNANARITRIGRQVNLELQPWGAVLTTSSGILTSNAFLNVDYRPANTVIFYASGEVGSALNAEVLLYCKLTSGGVLTIQPMNVSGTYLIPINYPNSTTIAMAQGCSVSYAVV